MTPSQYRLVTSSRSSFISIMKYLMLDLDAIVKLVLRAEE